MINTIAPWVLSFGANAAFAFAAFKLAKAFPKRINLVRIMVFGTACVYGVMVLGPMHASGRFGNLYWFTIAFGLVSLVTVFLYSRKFGLGKGPSQL